MNRSTNYDAITNTYKVPFVRELQSSFNCTKPLKVTVPGSKSITNRALLLATLANGTSVLKGALFSDDSRHFLKCVQDLGFKTIVDEDAKIIHVTGQGGIVPLTEASQYVGSAGTAARFLTAYLGISHGIYHMDASEQMRRRPMAPLLNSLQELGCEIQYPDTSKEGYFPFTLKSKGFGSNKITVDIEHSSQFLSALLIASCLCKEDFTVKVQGTHGMAYIEMTCKMMEQFGVSTHRTAPDTFVTAKGQKYNALDYQIEPDVSAACYFYALAPLLGIPVLVEHVHFDSLQGDVAFLKILEQMGCTLLEKEDGITVLPPNGPLHGITVDMSACSDQAITLAAIAPFADTPTTITGIGHIRFQESDRINAIVTELGKMGIRCEEDVCCPGSITIYPGTPKACTVDTYDDHRMAMGFSLIGLCAPDIIINDPGCCRKTFENYFQVLESVIDSLTS
ncbi:MAG: 3-phosphoshikimate 1-carboxyvinyltransferase [Lachnospiraceae bacterium]|nr:3-phosphoshikimate 1-carboxyvinyltransferase [Lachnospiraceae bacterium]